MKIIIDVFAVIGFGVTCWLIVGLVSWVRGRIP